MSRDGDYADDYDMEHEDDDLEHEDEYLDIPDEDLRRDLKAIEDSTIRENESQKVKKIFNEKNELRDRLDRGDISLDTYDAIYIETIKPQMSKAKTRCGQASVGLNNDRIADIIEDAEYLHKEDTRLSGLKDSLKQKISYLGPDRAQEEAERLLEEEIIGKDVHSRISRQVRIHRGYGKK